MHIDLNKEESGNNLRWDRCTLEVIVSFTLLFIKNLNVYEISAETGDEGLWYPVTSIGHLYFMQTRCHNTSNKVYLYFN